MSRRRKGPHIYRRPGRWGLYGYIDRDTKDIALGTDDEAEAVAALSDQLQRRGVPSLGQGEAALAKVFDRCDAEAVTNHTRKTAYELSLNLARVLGWLEGRGVKTTKGISRQVVEEYKAHRRETVGAARVNRELDSWRKAMLVAVDMGAPRAVLGCFVKLREPRPEPHQRRLNHGELARFLARVDDRYRPLFRLVLGSAIRDEEMRHLDRSDVLENGGERWIRVSPKPPGFCSCCPGGWTTKGYRHRRVPVTAETIAAARAFLAAPPPMDKRWVWEMIQRARRAAWVRPFSLHDLRKAWATSMVDGGNNLLSVSKWLGHADVQTTMRYLGISDDSMPAPEKLTW